MERHATQPAPVPTGRKRRRVCAKKKDEQTPPTSELVVALNALPRAEKAPPPPTQTLNELMDDTLKDFEEECMEEGTWQPDPATEVGEWEEYDLNEMEAKMNDLLYHAFPFHLHQFIHCLNPQTEFGSLRYKFPQEGCPVYLLEDNRLEQRGLLKCKCGFTPKMKLSRTSKN